MEYEEFLLKRRTYKEPLIRLGKIAYLKFPYISKKKFPINLESIFNKIGDLSDDEIVILCWIAKWLIERYKDIIVIELYNQIKPLILSISTEKYET